MRMNESGVEGRSRQCVGTRSVSSVSIAARLRGLIAVGVLAVAGASSSTVSAGTLDIYIATDQTGAQTQIDINHRSYWEFATTTAVADFRGGSFVMKRGNSAVGTVEFAVILGTYTDFLANYNAGTGVYSDPGSGSGSIVVRQSLDQTNFTNSFSQTAFTDVATTLSAATQFTAVLWSSVPDVQSQAFFVKQGGELFWSDSSGSQVAPTGYTSGENLVTTTNAVPGAGVAALVGLGMVGCRRRR